MQQRINPQLIDSLKKLRRQLHQNPELSGREAFTPTIILEFLEKEKDANVLRNLGGTGLGVVYDSKTPGPTTVFRCELDALPIQEINDFDYKSKKPGVSHKCGHDGHMAIVAGLGKILNEHPPQKGRVVLLFQPAEETGEGAEDILNDPRFAPLDPTFIYALHNVPELEKGCVYTKEGTFAAASRGIIIHLRGATSHAAEPENGRNPAVAIAEIIQFIAKLPQTHAFESLVVTTVVHAVLGEIAFGISPGYGEVRATLRAYSNDDMTKIIELIENFIHHTARREKLEVRIDYAEVFPETANDGEAVLTIARSAQEGGIPFFRLPQPFKWSEDFGHFLLRYKGAMFALGAGRETPKLHNYDYDFPDELIPSGLAIFTNIINYHNF